MTLSLSSQKGQTVHHQDSYLCASGVQPSGDLGGKTFDKYARFFVIGKEILCIKEKKHWTNLDWRSKVSQTLSFLQKASLSSIHLIRLQMPG